MLKPSSVCDSSPPDRGGVAENLYRERGARDASSRCDANSKLGSFDLFQTLVDALDLEPGHRVYDVGCGSGQHLVAFAEVLGAEGRAFGFDFSSHAALASTRAGARAATADAAALPVADASCDALTCNFAIYYHPDLDAASAELARVTRPGGRIAISGPAEGTNQELYDFHERATGQPPSDADLMALGYVAGPARESLARAGFDDLESHDYVNQVRFPSASAFLDYWKATSLFARTPGARVGRGERLLADHEGAFVVTKRVTVLTGRRA